MKKYDSMTKAELVRCIKALEKSAPASEIAFEHERLLHDLQVHQVELETQNRELREAQQIIELSRDRYADLYDFAPVGYVTLSDKGVIRDINLTAAAMLGVERSRLVGVPFHLYVAGGDGARFREHLRGLSDERVTTEVHLSRKGGASIPVVLQSVLHYDEGKKGFICRTAITDISERKQAEQALRDSASLNRSILSSMSAHVAVVDKAGNIIAVNEAWTRFASENGDTSFARSGVGANYLQICKDSSSSAQEEARQALEGIEAVLRQNLPSFEFEYPCHSPTVQRWFLMTVTPLSTEAGGAVISHVDITQRRMGENALAEKEARLSAVLETAVDAIITIDERGTVESINQAVVRLFGYTADELVGGNVSVLMPSPDRDRHDRYLKSYQDTGERKIIGIGREVMGRRKDGSTFPLDLSVSEVQLGSRRIFTGFLRDITERKRSEQSLRESEERLRLVLEASRIGMFEFKVDGGDFYWNSVEYGLLGIKRGDAPSTPETFFRFVHPDDVAGLRGAWERALETGEYDAEFRIVRADGEERWLAGQGRYVFKEGTDDKERSRFLGVNYDITDRRKAEAALRESEARFRSLSEASPLGICMADVKGQCTYTNPRWQEMSGLSEEENLGDGWTSVIHPEDRPGLFDAWGKAVNAGGELVWEFRIVRPDGDLRWVRTRSKSIVGSDGKLTGYVGIDEDITDLKRQERRRQMQYEVSKLLAGSASLTETLPTLLRVIAEACDCDVGEFWEVVPQSRQLHRMHVWHAPGRKLASFVRRGLEFSVSMFDGLPGEVLKTRKPHWIVDIARCSHFLRKREATRAGLRSALAFPILFDRETVGVMAFLTHRLTDPDEELLQMFVTLGGQIAQFMDRKQTEEALREANEFGKQVIGGAQAGIIVYDRQGRIVVWNPFMEQITGYTAAEVLGRRGQEAFPFTDEQHFGKMLERALAAEVFDAADIPFDLPEKGKRGWTVARFAPWRDARRAVVGVIVTVRDITERRRLETELLEISDSEQRRIGHDLHDGLGQQLTALEMKSFLILEDLAATDLEARRLRLREQAQEMSQALRECITVTRSISRGLAPVVLKTEGLMGALTDLAHRSCVPGKVRCRFLSSSPVMIDDLQVAKHLYRIAQEAVNNALKHARARWIHITLSKRAGILRLQIKDDGRGLPKARKAGRGMGVEVMRHRAHVIGASLEIDSTPGGGATVTCKLPMEKHEHKPETK